MTSKVMKGAPISIVAADDSDIIRCLISIVLKNDLRFQHLGNFSNGLQLLKGVEAMEFPPTVCLLDIMMPLCNGIEAAKILQMNYSNIIVFGYTSLQDKSAIERMYQYGVQEVFYKKEYPLNKIMDAIYEKCMMIYA